jgi:hypothetical protein
VVTEANAGGKAGGGAGHGGSSPEVGVPAWPKDPLM